MFVCLSHEKEQLLYLLIKDEFAVNELLLISSILTFIKHPSQ